jgi:hypothetical protein
VVSVPAETNNTRSRSKPRLTRQSAIVQDDSDPPGSPGRLTVRFLTTIPSAAETSVQQDEEPDSPSGCTAAVLHTTELSSHSQPYYAILHTTSSPQGSPSEGSPALQHITIHTSPHTSLDTGPPRRLSRTGLSPPHLPFLASSHRQQPVTSQSSPQLSSLFSDVPTSSAEHATSQPTSPAVSTPQQQTPLASQRQARHEDNTWFCVPAVWESSIIPWLLPGAMLSSPHNGEWIEQHALWPRAVESKIMAAFLAHRKTSLPCTDPSSLAKKAL